MAWPGGGLRGGTQVDLCLAEAGIGSGVINVMILPDSVELWGLVDFPEQLAAAEVAVSSVADKKDHEQPDHPDAK